MQKITLWLTGLLLLTASLSAQTDSAVFDDDPMQHRALNVEESKYRIRTPDGLEQVDRRVEPPNWWVDMDDSSLEVMVYDKGVADYTSAAVDYPGVQVSYVNRQANPNYLFIGLEIQPGTSPGSFPIRLASRDRAQKRMGKQNVAPTKVINYELLPHPRKGWSAKQALGPQDLIYLIMPDRFANGDESNDVVTGMNDELLNRQKFFFRHGGDLQGIINKLDYLEDLGVTALWLNPVLENDQPYASYHGYAVTDHYRIDRRFGTNEKYRELCQKANAKDIKIIMDVIFNHVGDEHYLMRDLPGSDWIHQWPEYTQTTYRAPVLMDPNASDYDQKLMTDGWFDKHMPDLNQQQPHLANYLIQNSIWWTLWSGQDGYRIDTYAYADKEFAAEWNRRLKAEIPHLGIYGETWVHGPGVQAWFTGGRGIHDEFDSHLPGVTDFQLYYAIHEAMGREPGWTEGVNRIYYTLAQDYLYDKPEQNVTFLDNHDIARLYTTLGKDMTKMKGALALLLTMRGIPMLYYGTEVGLLGSGGAFGEGGRVDFPGGFAGDTTNYFSPAGREGDAKNIHDFVSRLANYRKTSKALTVGELTQFVPRDGVYVYFRHYADETVMIVFNGNSKPVELTDLQPYQEMIGSYQTGESLTTKGEQHRLTDVLKLKGKEVKVMLLR